MIEMSPAQKSLQLMDKIRKSKQEKEKEKPIEHKWKSKAEQTGRGGICTYCKKKVEVKYRMWWNTMNNTVCGFCYDRNEEKYLNK